MTLWQTVAIAFGTVALCFAVSAATVWWLSRRLLARLRIGSEPVAGDVDVPMSVAGVPDASEMPCSRCGALASRFVFGSLYCQICSDVVASMLPAVGHDPPPGFPGGPPGVPPPSRYLTVDEADQERF